MLTGELESLIEQVDVVSFDVFDTLLLRRHYLPADVFTHAGGSKSFRVRRIAAEQLARIRHRPQKDVTYEQIYALLRHPPEAELQVERDTLFANPQGRAIYDLALERGKRVIAVSDMYLPEQFIRERLEQSGFTRVERVYVSCEADKTKGGGELFRHVVDDLGLLPAKILHVGDNHTSDVIRAREQGLRAWFLPSPRARFEKASPIHPEILRHFRQGESPSHSLLLGILRDGLADDPDARDYWYRWGFSVVGPIVNAFADWVASRFAQGGHDAVFLLARDGHLPQQILTVRHPEVPTRYTFASRRLFLVSSLLYPDAANLSALCASLPGTRAHEYWYRLGLSNRAVETLLHQRFASDERIWSERHRARVEQFFVDARPMMLPDVERENRILRDYATSIGLLGKGRNPLIVDIGWRASSQRFLEKAIPELKGTAGAYFALSDGAYRNGQMEAWLFNGFTPMHARVVGTHCVEIMELMFSAPHPSVRRIEPLPDGTFAPVYEQPAEEEQRRMEIVSRVHEGAMAFTRLLHERESAGLSVELTRDDALKIVEAIVMHPTEEEIRHLGPLPHALGLGSSRYETLLPPVIPWNPFTLLRTHAGRSPERLYWPAGLMRAITLQHGRLAGATSRIALTASWTIAVFRERLGRLLKK